MPGAKQRKNKGSDAPAQASPGQEDGVVKRALIFSAVLFLAALPFLLVVGGCIAAASYIQYLSDFPFLVRPLRRGLLGVRRLPC